MARINEHFLKLQKEYFFQIIEGKVRSLKERVPNAALLNLGIGDVAFPLAPSVAASLSKAALEMSETIYGYGSTEGYTFLREAILDSEYRKLGISKDEVFISDGINRDICDFRELFAPDLSVGIFSLAYPAYLDSNILAGSSKIVLLPCNAENRFCPSPPDDHLDLIYLCSPNNPTGEALSYDALKEWVDYARAKRAIIFFDGAYADFIRETGVPRSIYEIPHANEVAIEFRSFSKSAGFSGLRLGVTIVPKQIMNASLHKYWKLRQDIKMNGVSFPIQRAGLAALTDSGRKETMAQVNHYLAQARKIKESLERQGFTCFGGVNSPYVWWKIPSGNSWDFFELLLEQLHIVTLPGSGFGKDGDDYIRLSGFATESTTDEAIRRLKTLEVAS